MIRVVVSDNGWLMKQPDKGIPQLVRMIFSLAAQYGCEVSAKKGYWPKPIPFDRKDNLNAAR